MLAFAAVAVGLGTALGHGRASLARPATLVAVAGVVVVLASRRRVTGAVLAGLVAIAAAGAASAAWRAVGADARLLPALAERDAVVRVCGEATERRPMSVEVRVDRLAWHGRAWRIAEPLRISGEGLRRLAPGRSVCASGELRPPRPGRDEPPLMKVDRVTAGGVRSRLRYAAFVVRERFSASAQAALPRRQAGLLLGMTDGDVELVDDATMEEFRTTGLAHLVAVSGSNVAVLLALVMVGARALIPRGRWLRALLAVPPLVFFAFLTGLEPSVLRATVSAGVAVAVMAGGRTTDALRAASFAFIALVLASPDILFHPGFQLSFGATLGLIFWAGPLTERVARVVPCPSSRFSRGFATAAGTTLAAQIAVAPLLAAHFGRIPAAGGLANLVVVPLAGVVMVGGVATLTGASLLSFLDWAPATMRLLLDAILATAHTFAHVPAASLPVGVTTACAVTAGMAVVAARTRVVRTLAVASLVALLATAGGRSLAGTVTCPSAEIRALDVGQGTAVLVRTGEHTVLLDGGPAAGDVVGRLRDLGVEDVDVAVMSHPHADHVEGLADVLEEMQVGRVVAPAIAHWGVGRRVVAAARRAGVPVATAVSGDVVEAGPIRLEVLAPDHRPVPEVEDPDLINGYSLLVRATLAGVVLVSPGDLSAEDQSELLDRRLDANVLVAPHHGSSSVDAAFVGAVSPRITLVTVGGDNPYGHPSPKALRLFARYGAVMRTDTQGLVTMCVGDGTADVYTEREMDSDAQRGGSSSRVPDLVG